MNFLEPRPEHQLVEEEHGVHGDQAMFTTGTRRLRLRSRSGITAREYKRQPSAGLATIRSPMFDGLQSKLQEVFRGLRGEGRVSEERCAAALRQIRLALLEADVHFRVVKSFVERVEERALGAEVLESLTPDQQIVKIVRDELVALLGEEPASCASTGARRWSCSAACRARARPRPRASSRRASQARGSTRCWSPPTCSAPRRSSSSSRWAAASACRW